MQQILIPAKVTTSRHLRVWYIEPGTKFEPGWNWVDAVNLPSHSFPSIPGMIQLLRKASEIVKQPWKYSEKFGPAFSLRKQPESVIYAMQVVDVQTIEDNRHRWSHHSCTTKRVSQEVTPVHVILGKRITRKTFLKTARWVRLKMKNPVRCDHIDAFEYSYRESFIERDLVPEGCVFPRPGKHKWFVKIGPQGFIPFTPGKMVVAPITPRG